MGIIIRAAQPYSLTPPIAVELVLECDDASEMFCRGFERFEHREGYVGAHSEAMRAGWLERQSSRGRLWLCPTCSGKGRN